LICGILVFLMQAGFMCLEAGLVRQKNSINVAIKNVTDFLVSSIAFFAVGFGLMFGASLGGLIGSDGFFLTKYIAEDQEGWIFPFWFFQDVFCGTASTIVAGGVAERIRYRGYMWVSFTVAAIIYPVFGHWAWGGSYDLAPQKGWLAAMGYRDFAGSSVVHMVGGTATLACLFVLGPRKGRYLPDGTTVKMWGSNLPMAALGTFLLWIGWFGFNGGSTLALNKDVGLIIINTNLAACTGSLACLLWVWRSKGKPEVEAVLNGALGGLVAVTASCAYITPVSALAIGALGGVTVNLMSHLLERFHIDDAVDAVPVHLGAGMVGVLCVGLFAKEEFLVGGSRLRQIGVQALGMTVCFVFTFTVEWLLIRLFDRYITRLRVTPEDEDRGLNLSEHGARTLWLDLAEDMNYIERSHDLNRRAVVEPETEAGVVARMFNRLMDTLRDKTAQLTERTGALNASYQKLSEANKELVRHRQENEMFVYSVSHDLRSPLVNMTGFGKELAYSQGRMRHLVSEASLPSDIARKFQRVDEEMAESLHFIHTAVERMGNITEGLLRLSRTGQVRYNYGAVNLDAVVRRVVDSLSGTIAQHGATVRIGDLPQVVGDAAAIEQLYANLIENALNYLDATRPGEVEIGWVRDGDPANLEASDTFHHLYVKDNGMGIPEAAQPRLFQIFQRFHPNAPHRGNGIGLSIIRRIVERHGGCISVTSTEGSGSLFQISWPRESKRTDE
jgi:Amt family ammonium transporter